jgi:hypothetical protein
MNKVASEAKSDSSRNSNNQFSNPFVWAIFQLLFILFLPFLFINISDDSPFVVNCTSQYGIIILSFLLAGLISNTISSIERITKKGMTSFSKILSFLSALIIGSCITRTWIGDWGNGIIDSLEFWVCLGALFTVMVSYFSFKQKEYKNYYKNVLFYVDIPLFAGCFIIIVFKHIFFNESSESFINFIVEEIPTPEASTPFSNNQNVKVQNLLRDNYWLGFSTGVVTIQLITSQIVSFLIVLFNHYNKSSKNE